MPCMAPMAWCELPLAADHHGAFHPHWWSIGTEPSEPGGPAREKNRPAWIWIAPKKADFCGGIQPSKCWKYMEIYMEKIWKYMEIYGIIWKYMEIYGNIWTYMEIYVKNNLKMANAEIWTAENLAATSGKHLHRNWTSLSVYFCPKQKRQETLHIKKIALVKQINETKTHNI